MNGFSHSSSYHSGFFFSFIQPASVWLCNVFDFVLRSPPRFFDPTKTYLCHPSLDVPYEFPDRFRRSIAPSSPIRFSVTAYLAWLRSLQISFLRFGSVHSRSSRFPSIRFSTFVTNAVFRVNFDRSLCRFAVCNASA